MLSNYARKQLLKKVAAEFSEADVQWLATQEEFNKLCETSESLGDMVALGRQLLKKKPAVKKFANTIVVPDMAVK